MFGKGDAISMEHSEIFFEDQYILPNDFCQMDNIKNAQFGNQDEQNDILLILKQRLVRIAYINSKHNSVLFGASRITHRRQTKFTVALNIWSKII